MMAEVTGSNESAQPGWYPGPDGVLRYWDGAAWLDITPPDAEPPVPEVKDRGTRSRKHRVVWIAVAVALVLAAAGGAIGWKSALDRQAAEVIAQEEAAQKAEDEAAQKAEAEAMEAQRQAEADRVEQEAAVREYRAVQVEEIEDSIRVHAEEQVEEGLLVGPILEVICSPLGGGYLDDLTELTTTFECFVANEERDDGTYRGFFYDATMNWETGYYTYTLVVR